MTLLARAKDRASHLLNRYGGAASLVRTTTTAASPWDEPTTETTTHPVLMIETGMAEAYAGDATLIEAGDVHGVLQPTEPAFVPSLADRLRLRGHDHTLAGLEPIQPAPGGPTIAWRIHARR